MTNNNDDLIRCDRHNLDLDELGTCEDCTIEYATHRPLPPRP